MILDSTFVFDLMADDRDAFAKGVELVEAGEVQWLPTPVVQEAYYGAMTVRGETTTAEVRNRLIGYPRIDVDEEVARTAGRLLAAADDAVGGSSGVGANDAYIGAMADITDDAVLTENLADFEALGVATESY
jgi:predicted nucleic acid-binding protein